MAPIPPSPPLQAATLVARQIVAIPATYSNLHGPPAGQIVGIVLGSVAGFILIIWLIYSTCGPKTVVAVDTDTVDDGSVVVRERRKSSAGRSRRHSHSEPVVERVVVEERRERRGSVRSRSVSSAGVDEVVVIEDHSPPRRSKSKRSASGYRGVDPNAYAGGDLPMREVRHGRH